ncbi:MULTISPECIES: hypothetical protein [unclassified Micromonospora]
MSNNVFYGSSFWRRPRFLFADQKVPRALGHGDRLALTGLEKDGIVRF